MLAGVAVRDTRGVTRSAPTVIWFRRDLRAEHHQALAAATGEGPVVALFVIDPRFDQAGVGRRAALAAALADLHRATAGALVIRRGPPHRIVPAVATEVGARAVFVTRDTGRYGRDRDAAVSTALRVDGRTLCGVGWNYAVPPGEVVKADGHPYAVFTPFARAWRAALARRSPDDATDGAQFVGGIDGEPLPVVPDLIVDPGTPVGRADALERFTAFVDDPADYVTARDLPGVDGTSRLSTALRWGTVHPAELIDAIEDLRGDTADHTAFVTELAWREFYADVLFRQPRSAWRNLDTRMDEMPVDRDGDARRRFAAWAAGTTGFPVVDAGIRQLAATGWMHNRVRMITASFLVKDLHLPWQWGARYFLDLLTDGDLASNNLGWQWVAGTGTDAAPYFRVFNPTSQSRRFDPDGRYLRTWLPELRSLGDRDIHEPGVHRPPDYPPPMVDHAAERAEALQRYRHAMAVSTR